MAIRCLEGVPSDADAELFPHFKRVFETIAYAKVSESAVGAKQLGYLRDTDTVSINRAHHLHDAKQLVLAMAADGYREPQSETGICDGRNGACAVEIGD